MRSRFLRLLWANRERPRRDELDARLQRVRTGRITVMAAKDALPPGVDLRRGELLLSEKAELIERAKREVPDLRKQVASNLADLRRIAKAD